MQKVMDELSLPVERAWDAVDLLGVLERLLAGITLRVIACSGGVDSLLLATVAHRQNQAATIIAHAISPAVPAEATERVEDWAEKEGWALKLVRSGEFESEEYLRNPGNRCYFCKSNLYSALTEIAALIPAGPTLMSGANIDDLGEYRPGLIAASERAVRHPFVEAGIGKSTIRAIARRLKLPFSELPASPCLASRLYTGTRVTESRLRAVEAGERLVRERTGLGVVRCRVRETEMLIEVGEADRRLLSDEVIAAVSGLVRRIEPGIRSVRLDAEPYRPGRAFVIAR